MLFLVVGDRVSSESRPGLIVYGTVVEVTGPPQPDRGNVLIRFDSGAELWDDSRDLTKVS